MAVHFGTTSRDSLRRGFTLVELLVVIGIIAVLASLLMPALAAAKRQSSRVACMSGLHEIGNAFALYAHNNGGYWPMALHQWSSPVAPTTREKRWNHFISFYLTGKAMNEDGSDKGIERDIKNTRNVLWGCPSWDRVAWSNATLFSYDSDINNGYAMNIYTFAPAPTAMVGTNANWVYRSLPYAANVTSANGWYYKAVQWKQPSERALVFDSVNSICAVGASWPWWTPTSSPMPASPNGLTFTPDYNRHSNQLKRNSESTASINMLYCDGHVEYVSAKQAFKAIRFK